MNPLVADAPAPVAVTPASRLYALDNLRSFIIVLVVVFHAAMSYMLFAPSWWYVVDTKQSLGFFCFVMLCDVFMMPAMFLLAGYFALPSLLRKGQDAFARDKAKRVGIPWVVGTLILRAGHDVLHLAEPHQDAATVPALLDARILQLNISSRRSSGFSACCCCSTSA